MKEYLRTFKPVDFSSTSRLIASIIMILGMSYVYLMVYVGINEQYESVLGPYSLIFMALLSGFLFLLGIDNTAGFGRNSDNIKHKVRNWILFIVGNVAFFTITYLFIKIWI